MRERLGQVTAAELRLREVIVADALVEAVAELPDGGTEREQRRPGLVEPPGRREDASLVHPEGGGRAPVAPGLDPPQRRGQQTARLAVVSLGQPDQPHVVEDQRRKAVVPRLFQEGQRPLERLPCQVVALLVLPVGSEGELGEALFPGLAQRTEAGPGVVEVLEATFGLTEDQVLAATILQAHRVGDLVSILPRELQRLGVASDGPGDVPEVRLGDGHPVEDASLGVRVGAERPSQLQRLGIQLQAGLPLALLDVDEAQLARARLSPARSPERRQRGRACSRARCASWSWLLASSISAIDESERACSKSFPSAPNSATACSYSSNILGKFAASSVSASRSASKRRRSAWILRRSVSVAGGAGRPRSGTTPRGSADSGAGPRCAGLPPAEPRRSR